MGGNTSWEVDEMKQTKAAVGPLDAAIREMMLASERFATERLRRRRLSSLLERSDLLLAGLEELNLLEVKRVPERGLSQLSVLLADLPFEHRLPIGPRPSPTAAIDAVFDLQEAILRSITGSEPEAGEELEGLERVS
jgi:hypothetical protein